MDIKKRIQELSLDQKAKLYFMGLVRQGKIDTLPEDPKAAYVSMMMDKDDYGRSVSGKDKSTFMEPEDSMPAARARKMMGLEEGYNKIANKLYGVNYDKLSPQEQEYVRDTIDREPGGAFNPRLSGELKEMASTLGYLEENTPTVFDDKSMDELLDIILKYVEDPDDAEAELDRFNDGGFDALSNMVAANLDRDPEYKAWYNKLHSIEEIGMFHDPLGYEPDNDDEDEDLTFEPEDMDDPDEDLVIIGSGYLDIKSNFLKKTFPSMTNDEYAALGQKVVDQLHNGDKEAALDYIYSRINEDRDEEDEENDRNLAVDDIPDSLREIATELGYLKEGIDPNSEIADYVVTMFNSSVYDYEGIQSDVWSKAEYASTSYGEGSVFMDLVDHLKSVGGKDVLEGNPDIYLELLPNEDIQWKAEVTFNENLNEEKNCGCGKNPCETYGTINEGKVDISYTDPGFRFYKMKVDGKRLDREEGTKYLKDLGIVDDEGKDMEIPKNYDQSILDDIVKALKEKGIDADHDAAMDVS